MNNLISYDALKKTIGNKRIIAVNHYKREIVIPGETIVTGEEYLPGDNTKREGKEYRVWEPFRSKLAAAIVKGIKTVPINLKSKVDHYTVIGRSY